MRAWGPAICLVAAVAWTHAASGQAAGGAAEGLFDPSADGAVLELAPEAERDALASSLADAGRNWVELARALTALEEGERASCAWLVNHMPHLDRIEMKAETLIEHVRSSPVPPSRRTDRPIPPGLDALVLECLEKEPERRPSSARELADRLATCAVVAPWTVEMALPWKSLAFLFDGRALPQAPGDGSCR